MSEATSQCMSLPSCFAQLPGMYPNAAGKLVTNVPYKGKVGAPAPPRADSTAQLGSRTRPSCVTSLALPTKPRCVLLFVAYA